MAASYPQFNPQIMAQAGLLSVFAITTLQAQEAATDLADLSLEELVNVQVTSVSGRAESLAEAPSSIYVITSEAIRRSTATTLPEVLRLAPNLQVARINSTEYAISARGFNNAVGNKLLVLIDGRTVYSPLMSGVFWGMQDVMLEDIERVEVISGPGATLWGANAVNGVINVITRPASETTSEIATLHAGSKMNGAAFRGGTEIGERGYARVYARVQEWDNTRPADLPDAVDVEDQWERAQVGFRADWTSRGDQLTLQGDAFQGESGHRGTFSGIEFTPIEVSGANLLGRWTRQLSEDSEFNVQAYWSHSEREDVFLFRPEEDIVDLEFQHSLSGDSHNLVWGGGYRHAWSDADQGLQTVFIPERRELAWGNIFVQDEIQLSDSVRITPGLKLETNDYTGTEHLPSLRLAWNWSDNHMLWATLSRAVRAPARFDREVYTPTEPPYVVAGGPDFESEIAHVVELGFRGQPTGDLNYSLTLFHHDWDRLRSGTPLPLPVHLANNIRGESYGVEGWADWRVNDFWLLRAGFTTLNKNLHFKNGLTDTVGVDNPTLHNDPDYQWSLRSAIDLSSDLELDIHLRRVAALTVEPVPAYTELNMRLGWQLSNELELSLSGRDLLNESHPEYGALPNRSEIGRAVLLQLRWAL